MLGDQEVRDAVERLVVDQHRAQQRLLRLHVVGREAEGLFLSRTQAMNIGVGHNDSKSPRVVLSFLNQPRPPRRGNCDGQ